VLLFGGERVVLVIKDSCPPQQQHTRIPPFDECLLALFGGLQMDWQQAQRQVYAMQCLRVHMRATCCCDVGGRGRRGGELH
jgi:hypothetical protein